MPREVVISSCANEKETGKHASFRSRRVLMLEFYPNNHNEAAGKHNHNNEANTS